MNVKEGF